MRRPKQFPVGIRARPVKSWLIVFGTRKKYKTLFLELLTQHAVYEMNIAVTENKDHRFACRLSGIDVALMNVIRHSIYADVPVYATNVVTFIQYDGPLEVELISHRIGQLPIRLKDDSACSSTTSTEPIQFRIEVLTDPEKAKLTWVTSKHVFCPSGRAEVVHYRSEDEEARACKDEGFLLCPLHAGQRLVATFTATVDTAREATRWNSCHPTVRPVPGTDDSFDLTIQTTGAVKAKDAFMHALSCIEKRLGTYRDSVALAYDRDA